MLVKLLSRSPQSRRRQLWFLGVSTMVVGTISISYLLYLNSYATLFTSVSPLALNVPFTAAVYEHAAYHASATTRKEAVVVMLQNLDILAEQATIAKLNRADIIVFPEYGITGDTINPDMSRDPRSVLYPYMELVPDVGDELACSLCAELRPGTEAQQSLACIAKKNQMYVVGNMIEMVRCNNSENGRCPRDGHSQYNTNLIFDRNGCLIAKYHKYHLYANETVTCDRPDQPEYVYFDTEFGRFGTMICFDALYKEPGVTLVEKYGVDHILFTTFWDNKNDFVYARSNQWFIGWAIRMGVNFIASNFHNITEHSQGSVLASPNILVNYTFDALTNSGHLLTGSLPPTNRKYRLNSEIHPTVTPPRAIQAVQPVIYSDVFNATILEDFSGAISICYGSFCCVLEYRRNSTAETFILGAFVGMHTFEGPYYVEVCLLYRCGGTSVESCSDRVTTSTTSFSSFNLIAKFGAEHVFPNILPSAYEYKKIDWDFRSNGFVNQIHGGSTWPLVSAALVGRDFTKD